MLARIWKTETCAHGWGNGGDVNWLGTLEKNLKIPNEESLRQIFIHIYKEDVLIQHCL